MTSARWRNADVLVYTTAPFKEGLEVTGSMTRRSTCLRRQGHRLHGEGDRCLSGRSRLHLDESIQRMRYRNGYDKPPYGWSQEGLQGDLLPLVTSNYFDIGTGSASK